MFRNTTKQDEDHYIDLIVYYSGYTRKEIVEAVRTKAKSYNQPILYFLRVWQSKAYSGNFDLDNERY